MLSNLEVLFTSAARVQVLRLLLLHPDGRFYQREIERETGQPIRAVQREVKRLTEVELLCRSEEGNRVFYGVNPEFPLLPELTALFLKASGVEAPAKVRRHVAGPTEPQAVDQPFPWLEPSVPREQPVALRRLQVEGEWDRSY